MPTGGSPRPFAFRRLSSEPDPPLPSTVVSIARLAIDKAYVIVDPILKYPPPTGVRFHFQYQQGGPVWRTPPIDPIQFGSGFIIVPIQPGVPMTALRYFGAAFDWWNIYDAPLLQFALPVPWP